MKKIISALLIIVLGFSIISTVVFAKDDATTEYVAEFNNVKYKTLVEAVDALLNSESKKGTVTMLKDSTGGGIGLFNAKGHNNVELTIDFGGYTYTCDDPSVGSTGTETQGFHLEKGNKVTLKNGTIAVSSESTNTKMLIKNYCDLTLENLKLEGAKITQYIISCNYGNTKMANVSISGTYPSLVAIDVMHWLGTQYKDKAPTMVINNNNSNVISGAIDIYCYGNGSDICEEKPTLTVSGGKYTDQDVKNYIAEGYITAEEEGLISVLADKSELNKLITDNKNLKEETYTIDSWKTFKTALTNAETVANNVNATKAEIDEAIKNLTNAYKALEKTPPAPEKTEVKVEADVEVTVNNTIDKVVNSNDKVVEYINKGVEVKTEVEVKDVEPTEEDKTTIANVVPKATIAKYFDINILIKDATTNKQLDKITELSENVEFTIELDEELKNVPEGFERVYKVIRMHDGKAESIETILSDDKNSITFNTDRFSIYAISYEDVAIKGTDGSENEEQDKIDNKEETDKEDEEIVQTGDYIHIAVGIFAIVLIANVVYFIKKRNK